MRFRAGQRLRRQSEFRAVREKGRRLDCGAFTLWSLPRPEAAGPLAATVPRVGVVASRIAVGNAIQRNRAKRRLREIFRRHQALVPARLDLVIVARSSLNRLAYAAVEQKFTEACRRLAPPAPSRHD